MSQSTQGVYLDREPRTIVGIKLPRIKPCKYDGVGGWAPNSSAPPGGWWPVWIKTAAVVAVFFCVAYIGAAAGF